MTAPFQLRPIDGQQIRNLYTALEPVFVGGEHLSGSIKDLDIAMLMNVPPGRMPDFKKAVSGGAPDMGANDKPKRVVKPSQAVLTRLLLRYPHYAPLVPMPAPETVWEHVRPLVPDWLIDPRHETVSQIIFGPLFGRSFPTSYKFLAGSDPAKANTFEAPNNVMRLFMLVMERLGDVFRQSMLEYLRQHAPESVYEQARRSMKRNWLILYQQPRLIDDLLPAADRKWFAATVHERKRAWFELYIQVLCDEAVSRDLDPRAALTRGHWRTKEPVTPESRAKYQRRQQPITGADMGVFERIRNGAVEVTGDESGDFSEALPSSEFFWLIGVGVKAFYGFGNKPQQRIDPVTAILTRYLYRYIQDVALMLTPAASGARVLEQVQRIDPDFRVVQLAPLFGGAYSSSYQFVKNDHCPHDLRRLVGIFMREVEFNPDIYWQIRQCVEEEAYARGISTSVFWHELRWHPQQEVTA